MSGKPIYWTIGVFMHIITHTHHCTFHERVMYKAKVMIQRVISYSSDTVVYIMFYRRYILSVFHQFPQVLQGTSLANEANI